MCIAASARSSREASCSADTAIARRPTGEYDAPESNRSMRTMFDLERTMRRFEEANKSVGR
jgi:hypothetical protein